MSNKWETGNRKQGTGITERAKQWLTRTNHPRVLHLFDEVCNLVNERGEVLALQTAVLPLGPFSWQVASLPHATADSIVAIDWQKNCLTLGAAVFCWQTLPVWNPIPDWSQLRKRPFSAAPCQLEPMLNQRWQAYLAAVAAGNKDETMKTAVTLAGLGNGLTPSGDDLLVGSLYALWVWGAAPSRIKQISSAAADHTSTLSANFLQAAGVGEAIAPWHALAAGQPNAIDQIVAVGHHSGEESWFGFCKTLEILTTQNLKSTKNFGI